jgi:hypothetical protein
MPTSRRLHIAVLILVSMAWLCPLLRAQPAQVQLLQDRLSQGDSLFVRIQGEVRSTGDCGSSPMFVVEKRVGVSWIDVAGDDQTQSMCGLPTFECEDCTLPILRIGIHPFALDTGTYRIRLRQPNFLPLHSTSFVVEEVFHPLQHSYLAGDSIQLRYRTLPGLGLRYSTCNGLHYSLEQQQSDGSWLATQGTPPCLAIYPNRTSFASFGTLSLRVWRAGHYRVLAEKRTTLPNADEPFPSSATTLRPWYSAEFWVYPK